MGCHRLVLAVGAVSLGAGPFAAGADRTWFGGDGGFQVASNWNPTGVPDQTDRIFLNSGIATILSGLGVSGGACADGFIGDEPGSNATIVINEANPPTVGGGFSAANHLVIGNRGRGAFSMGGTRLTLRAQTISLGAQPGAIGGMSISGSLFTDARVNGNMYVGGSPDGPGGSGSVTVSGGSQSGELNVVGTLVIHPGGSVQMTGGNAGSFGHLRQEGGFLRNLAGNLGAGFTITGTYELNGGSTELRGLSAGNLRVGGGRLGVVAVSRIRGDVVVAPPTGVTTPAVFDLAGGAEMVVAGNLHVGGNTSGPIGPALLRSAAQLRGESGSSVTIHRDGVLAETSPLQFPGGIDNHGTVRPNENELGQLRVGAGNLRLAGDGTLDLSIHSATASDSIVSVGGSVQVDGLLAASFAGPFTSNPGDRFLVISAPYSGRFRNPQDLVMADERLLRIEYQPGQVHLTDVGAVPEPGGFAPATLLGVGRRRRRR